MSKTLRGIAAVVLAVALAGACSSSSKSSNTSPSATTPPAAAAENAPAYSQPGPYSVGFTMLRLPDRDVAVWYPTDGATVAGKKKATYNQAEPLPAGLKGLVPDKFNTVVTMNAYPGVQASTKGPFPVVLFSHGAGGYALAYSGLTAGIASWGFVVVSAEYFEYGIVSQVTQKKYPKDPDRGKRTMLASLDLVAAESAKVGSLLHGAVDSARVATLGHSAGGNTAFNALNDPRVHVAVGWAPVAPTGPPANKPTMIIGMQGDVAFTPAVLTKTYLSFPAPKRFVELGTKMNSGHNSFTDVCTVIRQGGGLVEFARQNGLVAANLLDLATNGCLKTDLPPQTFWPAIQHFTVAEIRNALGIDGQAIGLGDGITDAFPGVAVKYVHQP